MINFVVIDLGSNSVRMKISQIAADGDYQVVAYRKEYVRLSENMGKEKILKAEPIKRTLAALANFKKMYSKFNHLQIHAVATAAVRQAKNQAQFLQRVQKEIGLKLKVISGKREAYLDYLGVVNTLPVKNGVIMDTGGASTELIWVQEGRCERRISVPFGSVLLTQAYNLADKVTAPDLFRAMTYAEIRLAAVPWIGQVHNLPLIALGGSNRTIAKISRRKLVNDIDDLPDIHGMHLPAENIFKLFADLCSKSRAERMQIPGLAKNRADVIVGGLIPINLILRSMEIGEVIFSNHGLRDGLLFEYLEKRQRSDAK